MDWELYGSDRCSVLVLTGIFKFLFKLKTVQRLGDPQDQVSETAWSDMVDDVLGYPAPPMFEMATHLLYECPEMINEDDDMG